jgi:catechol-2,3-dioxygenase
MSSEDPRVYLRTVHIAVADLDRSIAYYRDGLGLPVSLDESGETAIVRLGHGTKLLLDPALGAELEVQPHRQPGNPHNHFHLEVVNAPELASALEHQGHPVERSASNSAEFSIFVTSDPDGHNLEIFSRQH